MAKEEKVRATITLFGEPHRVPEPGDRVELRVSDGSWQSGFRCISDPLEEGGEQVVWVTREEEYQRARREDRTPASNTWPVSQIVPTNEGY